MGEQGGTAYIGSPFADGQSSRLVPLNNRYTFIPACLTLCPQVSTPRSGVRKTEVLACCLTLPQLLDTMLPDVLACMVKVYMSCVVSTPQTPVLDSSDQL